MEERNLTGQIFHGGGGYCRIDLKNNHQLNKKLIFFSNESKEKFQLRRNCPKGYSGGFYANIFRGSSHRGEVGFPA